MDMKDLAQADQAATEVEESEASAGKSPQRSRLDNAASALLNRRNFLKSPIAKATASLPIIGLGSASQANASQSCDMDPRSDLLLHTVRRTSICVTPRIIDQAASYCGSGAATRDDMLNYLHDQIYQGGPDTTVEGEIDSVFPQVNIMTAPELYDCYNVDNSNGVNQALLCRFPQQVLATAGTTISRILWLCSIFRWQHSSWPLYEKLVMFWANHFHTSLQRSLSFMPMLKTVELRDVFRPNALASFGALLRASAASPAMIVYLDAQLNRVGSLNENYPRELLELHTLSQGYSEDDIVNTARVLTGIYYHQNHSTGPAFTYHFVNQYHDRGTKTVLNQQYETAPSDNGEAEIGLLLRNLAQHPETVKFISGKLINHFIGSAVASDVTAIEQAFASSRGNIKHTLMTLFETESFWYSMGKKYKTPQSFITSVSGSLDSPFVNLDELDFDDHLDSTVLWAYQYLQETGQQQFYWPTPDGEPDDSAYWASTDGVLKRLQSVLDFICGDVGIGLPGLSDVDIEQFYGDAATPEELLDYLSHSILHRDLPPTDRSLVLQNIFYDRGVSSGTILNDDQKKDYAKLLIVLLISSHYYSQI